MKRLAILLGVLSLSIYLAPNASANTIHGQQCQTHYNDAFTKAEKVCINVIQASANNDWWVQFVGSVPSGYAAPYQVAFDGKMFSSKGGTICNGLYRGCSGSGNLSGVVEPGDTW